MLQLKIAIRNIFKNGVRSILTMLSIIVGMIAVVIANGFVNYSMWGLKESMIRNGIGHFQIYKKGFIEKGEDQPFDYRITDYKKILKELYRISGVDFVAPEVSFQGILSSGEKTAVVIGKGGFAEEEKKLNSFASFNGDFISDEDEFGVVLGKGLAKKLNAKIGDTLTLMITMKGGGINASDVLVKGMIQLQIDEYNNTLIIAPINLIQKLQNTENSVDRLIVMYRDTDSSEKMKTKIEKLAGEYDLEYKSWKDLAKFYFQVKEMYDTMLLVMFIVIIGIVVFAIANTMTINVLERIPEIGIIRAIGAKRKYVMSQFILESLMIGVFGGVFGLILGYFAAFLINLSGGIYIPPPPGSAEGYFSLIRPEFIHVLFYFAIFMMVSVSAAILPARKAAKMEIVEAIRWI